MFERHAPTISLETAKYVIVNVNAGALHQPQYRAASVEARMMGYIFVLAKASY